MVLEAAAAGTDGRANCASSVVDNAIRADRPPPHVRCLRGFQGKRAAFFSAGLCVSARNLVPPTSVGFSNAMMEIPVAGIYISWPFCAQKCTYCNFASGVLPRELESRYLAALLKEISSHPWQWTPDTVYLGGGTPSGMEADHLLRLLNALPGRWLEATIEAAPGSLTSERIDAWLRAGINRVSLGVQSFIRQELARTGRKHTREIVPQEVALLRAHGIHNINIDLIAGLPGQTESSWAESLAAAISLDPPHVSVYMLEVDDDSRLGAEILLGGKRYGATDVPSDDCIADFYETAVERGTPPASR